MTQPPAKTPFYRDTRGLAIIAQVVFLALVVLTVLVLSGNLQRGLRDKGLNTSFDFLSQPAGFGASEGPAFTTNLEAFGTGLYNTLRVAVAGIVLSSLFGLIIGVARLSSNWLVNRLALVYVDLIRNTPLLVQIVFWYSAVILQMPGVRQALKFGPDVYLSQQGLALPWLVAGAGFGAFWPWLAAGLALALVAWSALARRRARMGRPFPAGWVALGSLVLTALVGWALASSAGTPLEISRPVLGNFRLEGGLALSPEYTALLISLVVYTTAFIAEIVRAGIQSVPKGQTEAARSLGLRPLQALGLVVLPQALRVILPPLGNQYLNLTKNSSLAVAIAYPDLFNLSQTIGNTSGRNIQAIVIVLSVYLVLSLLIAAGTNLANRGARLRAR